MQKRLNGKSQIERRSTFPLVCKPRVVPVLPDSGSHGYQFHFTNNCSGPVKVALHYRDLSNNWRTEGWWQFAPGEEAFLSDRGSRLASNNSFFYFYSETTDSGSQAIDSGETYQSLNGRRLGFKKMRNNRGNAEFSARCTN